MKQLAAMAIAISMLLSAGAAEPKVRVVAYINQQAGCQTQTEAFLKDLARQHGKRVSVEIVDFGGSGRKRWQDDGMKCMGILVDGTTSARIIHMGATLQVSFEMPAGYKWQHEDLAIAVRQKLDGISAEDRLPPAVTVAQTDDGGVMRIADQDVAKLADIARLKTAAAALLNADPKVILQEEFSPARDGDTVTLMLRGKPVLNITTQDAQAAGKSLELFAGRCFGGIAASYPRKTRPFPGAANPHARAQ